MYIHGFLGHQECPLGESCLIWESESCHIFESESCGIWMSHVSYECVMSHMSVSCLVWVCHVSYECVMSHMSVSQTWISRSSRVPFSRWAQFAVCCSVLQCVAVRCRVLQCVALRCNALQCDAVRCSVLQLLQCVAVRRSAVPMDVLPKLLGSSGKRNLHKQDAFPKKLSQFRDIQGYLRESTARCWHFSKIFFSRV